MFTVLDMPEEARIETGGVPHNIFISAVVTPAAKDNESVRMRSGEILRTQLDGPGIDLTFLPAMVLELGDRDFDTVWAELGEQVKKAQRDFVDAHP